MWRNENPSIPSTIAEDPAGILNVLFLLDKSELKDDGAVLHFSPAPSSFRHLFMRALP